MTLFTLDALGEMTLDEYAALRLGRAFFVLAPPVTMQVYCGLDWEKQVWVYVEG